MQTSLLEGHSFTIPTKGGYYNFFLSLYKYNFWKCYSIGVTTSIRFHTRKLAGCALTFIIRIYY